MARPTAEMVIAIKGNTRDFSSKIDRVLRAVDRINRRLRAMQAAARTAFVAASGAGFLAIRTFATYERQMTRVGQVTAATERQFGALKDTARGLGATTEFTATQAAQGMYFLGLAGLEVNDILEATSGVLNLALVGEISLADAARVTARVLNVYGFEASKAAVIADMLAKNVSSANITMREQTEALEFALSAAKLAKVPLEDVLSIIAKLGDAGVAASRGGTAIRRFINQIQKSAKELGKFGIEVYDADGKINSVLDILGQFEVALAGLTDEQKRAITSTFGEIRAQEALNLLLSAGTAGLLEHAEALRQSEGFADAYAKALRKDVIGQLIQLKSRLDEIAIAITSLLLPEIHKATQSIKDFQDKIIGLSDANKRLIGQSITIAGRFSGMVLISAILIRSMVNVGGAIVVMAVALRNGAIAARGFWIAMGLGLTLVIPALIEGYLYLQRTNSRTIVDMEYAWKGFWSFADKGFTKMIIGFIKMGIWWQKTLRDSNQRLGEDFSQNNAKIHAGEQRLHAYTTELLEAKAAADGLPRAYALALAEAAALRRETAAIGAETKTAAGALKEGLDALPGDPGGGVAGAGGAGGAGGGPGAKTPKVATAESKRAGWLRGTGWEENGETDRAERELQNLETHEARKKEIILAAARDKARQEEEIRRKKHQQDTKWERLFQAVKTEGFKSQNRIARAGNKALRILRMAEALSALRTAITVDAPLAFSKTAARFGYPLGPILGALVAGAIVAKAADGIASLKKYEYGGVVGSSGVVGGAGVRDTQLIRARAGELVADPTLTGNLSQMAESFLGPGGGSGGGGTPVQVDIILSEEKLGEALFRVGENR